MDIQQQITSLNKEISTIESRIEADQNNLKALKSALRSFLKIEEQAKAIQVPNLEKKLA